jgi:Cys-tRNA(Pro) deacylase
MESKLQDIVEQSLKNAGIAYKVLPCSPDFADTAAFCEEYGVAVEQAANTIIVASKKVEPTKYVVCIAPGNMRLDVNNMVRKLMEVKRASFASAEDTKALSGMMIGGVTPFGIKDIPIYVDANVLKQKEVVMGGGNRSAKVLLNPQELTKLPNVQIIEDLAKLAA